MSSDTHVVLCVDKDLAQSWPMKEVIKRWHQMHQGTLLSQKYHRGDKLSKGECITLAETVAIYRQCLYDISRLMRNLNEYVAREANKENKCTGRFYLPPSLALIHHGLLKLFKFFPEKFCGKDDLNLKHY